MQFTNWSTSASIFSSGSFLILSGTYVNLKKTPNYAKKKLASVRIDILETHTGHNVSSVTQTRCIRCMYTRLLATTVEWD